MTSGDTALLQIRDWGPGLRTTNPRLLFKLLQKTKSGHRGVGLVTVERIARLLFDVSREQGLPVSRVTVWETPSSWATYKA